MQLEARVSTWTRTSSRVGKSSARLPVDPDEYRLIWVDGFSVYILAMRAVFRVLV